MKKILFMTVILLSVLALGYSQSNSWNVNNTSNWIEAVGAIRSGGNNKDYTINVTGNISIPSSTENTFGSVSGITITIQGNGTLSPSANGSLLYIGAGQTIITRDLTLRGRNANNTSVIVIEKSGTLRMEGNATITGNVNNANNAHGGGVYVTKGGTLTMLDNASVSVNTANGSGGGVYLTDDDGYFEAPCTFTMQGNASVSGNTSYGAGGGVYVFTGTFTMRGNTTVSGNVVNASKSSIGDAAYGGGVYIDSGWAGNAIFIMQDDASVKGNTLANSKKSSYDNAYGGGVYVKSYPRGNVTFTMRDRASVTGNTSNGGGGRSYGGGVYIYADVGNKTLTFTMQGNASVSNNIAKSNDNRTSSYGGGVYLNRVVTFIMRDSASISGNTADGDGGGVYISYESSDGAFKMEGGIISGNTAISKGGGVYLDKGAGREPGIFTMQSNASVSGNTANNDGGGIYVNVGGTINFTVEGNASISGNTSNRNGGGVSLSDNSASWDKGGILTISGNASISSNTANYGGGVILYGGRVNMEGGTISGNIAKNDGGGVYLNGGNINKTSGNLYGYDAPLNLANRGVRGNSIYDEKGGRWRNISAGTTMNSETYGFWLNDEVEYKFPSEFIGTWKRANFNNTLTLTEKTTTISSNSYTYELLGISGDSYTLKRNNANPFTLGFKLTSGNLVISGDSGSGQDNWNGTWMKQ